ELPAVPRAADELAPAHQLVLAGLAGLHQPDDPALAQLGTHVRAAVGERVVLPADVEDADLAAHGGDDLAGARLDLPRLRPNASAHARPYNARALSLSSMAFCSAASFSLANTWAGSSKSQCG